MVQVKLSGACSGSTLLGRSGRRAGRQAGSTGFSSRQWDVCARLSVQTEAVARFVISALCLWEHKDLYYRKRAVEGVTALQN